MNPPGDEGRTGQRVETAKEDKYRKMMLLPEMYNEPFRERGDSGEH